jgi:hypothetical protein
MIAVEAPEREELRLQRRGTGTVRLLNDAWPQRVAFTGALLRQRPEHIRWFHGHVDMNLANGRAVYYLYEHDKALDIYAGRLVYSEGPT